jgi:hypothetical protein
MVKRVEPRSQIKPSPPDQVRGRLLPLPRGCVAINETIVSIGYLSFRPQGEILDPSHSFGMTTRLLAIATQSPNRARVRNEYYIRSAQHKKIPSPIPMGEGEGEIGDA